MEQHDSGRYILLAEDNLPDVFLIREAIDRQHLGCELRVVSDGAEALALIDEIDRDTDRLSPKLLLLDLHLPKEDGDSILGHLRSTRRLRQTPVVVMSSSESPRDLKLAADYGALPNTGGNSHGSRMSFPLIGRCDDDRTGPDTRDHRDR